MAEAQVRWTVTARLQASGAPIEALTALLDRLADADPAGSFAADGISVRFSVDAVDPASALQAGLARLEGARGGTQLEGAETTFASVNVEGDELGAPGLDELRLLGVHEVAERLELSPTQVAELADDPRFPEPVARLAQGPVWEAAHVERHIERLEARA